MNLEDVRAEAMRISKAAWSTTATAETPPIAAEAYYDAEADRAAREAFYGGFELPADAREAYVALYQWLAKPHRPLPYKEAKKRLHSWIDVHENGRLRSIYSNEEVDPAVLRAAEEEIERLFAKFPQAKPPYNVEHVVPRAWFDDADPMDADLHHLFTCETDCNDYRGSHPFFDFEDDTPTLEKCGRRDKPKRQFEPLKGKGPVARATLYFIVRYPGVVNRTGEYDPARIAMLKQWHFASLPELWEKRRNFTIEKTQNNRNPFVDEPEWVRHVDFDAGLGY